MVFEKVVMAARLRAETVVTVKRIAQRVHMVAPAYVNHLRKEQRE